MSVALPLLYTDLASWFHLLSAPEEYVEEATVFRETIRAAAPANARTLLELGSGAGCNASHLKRDFACTLVDPSEGMLDLSRKLNPDCEHLVGDMRTVRLGRTFDVVFVHDAVMYMTDEADLRLAMETAFAHAHPGTIALFVPDCVRETFAPRTDHGGNDGEGRALRYLEWCWDPDPSDTTITTDYAYLLRESDRAFTVHDRHIEGLFPRATWLSLLADVGFEARALPRPDDVDDIGERFLAVRR
jgi:hypothetical protein